MAVLATAGFRRRSIGAADHRNRVIEFLESQGFDVFPNGIEHMQDKLIERLRDSMDPTGLMIRYRPDDIAIIGEPGTVCYIEEKNSKYIERDAIDNYVRLTSTGAVVAVFFNYEGHECWGFADEIKTIEAIETTDSWWPVRDGWHCPREHSDWPYIAWQRGFRGSGTSYRQVNLLSLHRSWDDFMSALIKKGGDECLNL